MIALADRLAMYTKHLREGIDQTDALNEMDTNDLYVEVSRAISKLAEAAVLGR